MTLIHCLLAGLLLQVNDAVGQSAGAEEVTVVWSSSQSPASAVEQKPALEAAAEHLASLASAAITPPATAQNEQATSPASSPSQATPPAYLIRARLSKNYIAEFVEREVDRTKPVRDLVLGITFLGESHTKGRTRLVLLPSEDRASAEVEFAGTVQSRTAGRKGPANLRYVADTKFTARKPLTISSTGVVVGPAVVNAETQLTPTSISTNLPGLRGRIVGQIARNREAGQRSQANGVVADHTADDIKQSFDKRLDAAMAALQKKVQAEIAQLKLEENLSPGREVVVKSRSTPEYVELAFCDSAAGLRSGEKFSDDFEVAGNPDIAFQVHRTVLTRTLANESLREKFAPLFGSALIGQLRTNEAPAAALPGGPSRWSLQGDWLMLEFADASLPRPTIAVASADAEELSR